MNETTEHMDLGTWLSLRCGKCGARMGDRVLFRKGAIVTLAAWELVLLVLMAVAFPHWSGWVFAVMALYQLATVAYYWMRRVRSADRKKAQEAGAHAAGLQAREVDHHGELELRLHVDGQQGSCFLSREMWRALGEKAGWLE
jgi:hypothetical protein